MERDADERTIKRAYRKLAIKWHPDKNPDTVLEAKEAFVNISTAYNVLSDDAKRKQYDLHGKDGLDDHMVGPERAGGGPALGTSSSTCTVEQVGCTPILVPPVRVCQVKCDPLPLLPPVLTGHMLDLFVCVLIFTDQMSEEEAEKMMNQMMKAIFSWGYMVQSSDPSVDIVPLSQHIYGSST